MKPEGKDALMRFIQTVITAALTAIVSVFGVNQF